MYVGGTDKLVQSVDRDAVAKRSDSERYTQRFVRDGNPISSCSISYIITPPGGGSPEGLHTHDVDQVFFLLQGTMGLEIGGRDYEAAAGSLITFPKGVPHRNWNAGSDQSIHLGIRILGSDPR